MKMGICSSLSSVSKCVPGCIESQTSCRVNSYLLVMFWFLFHSLCNCYIPVNLLCYTLCLKPMFKESIWPLHRYTERNTVTLCSWLENSVFVQAQTVYWDIHTNIPDAVSDTQPVRKVEWVHKSCSNTERSRLCDLALQIIVQETAQLGDQGSIQVEMMDAQDIG